jgi:hypothetical protein
MVGIITENCRAHPRDRGKSRGARDRLVAAGSQRVSVIFHRNKISLHATDVILHRVKASLQRSDVN